MIINNKGKKNMASKDMALNESTSLARDLGIGINSTCTPIINDVLSIALPEPNRTCISHPVSSFVSFDLVSPMSKSFLLHSLLNLP